MLAQPKFNWTMHSNKITVTGSVVWHSWTQFLCYLPVFIIDQIVYFSRCTWIHGKDGEVKRFLPHDQQQVVRGIIEPMASEGLRTICLAYKDYVTGKVLNAYFCNC